MAAKKPAKQKATAFHVFVAAVIAVGIYLVVVGVLSTEYSDNMRSVLIAGGLGIYASGVIGFAQRVK